jgi:hypothetical protein
MRLHKSGQIVPRTCRETRRHRPRHKVRRGSGPSASRAIACTRGSVSTEMRLLAMLIPLSNQHVPRPHPVPSSRNEPPGFVLASTRSKEPVSASEFIENCSSSDRARMQSYCGGVRMTASLTMGAVPYETSPHRARMNLALGDVSRRGNPTCSLWTESCRGVGLSTSIDACSHSPMRTFV